MSHKRSQEAKTKRRNSQRDRDIANNLVLNWSWHDQLKVPGEIVFAEITVGVCCDKIQEKLGYIPESVLEHEFGEVLNLK
jgi:hypothetical protein